MFYDMKPEEILNLFKDIDYKIKTFSTKEIIALEGDKCKYIGIILTGTVDIKRMLSNKVVKVTSDRKSVV